MNLPCAADRLSGAEVIEVGFGVAFLAGEQVSDAGAGGGDESFDGDVIEGGAPTVSGGVEGGEGEVVGGGAG